MTDILTERRTMKGVRGVFPPAICRVLPGQTAITIRESDNVTLNGWVFEGTGTGIGLYLLDCGKVTLNNCRFTGLLDGLATKRVRALDVSGCDFGYMTGNGMILAETSGRIADNLFHDFDATSTAHRDACQLANPIIDPDPKKAVAACTDILFEGNTVRGSCQGFFTKSGTLIIVRDNQLRVSFANAIAALNASDVLIEDNDIRSSRDSDTIARMDFRGSTNVRFVGRNVAMAHTTPAGRVFREIPYPVGAA